MSEELDDQIQGETEDESSGADFLIDILTGESISASPKSRLVQKVLRQLIESYGFDRKDARPNNDIIAIRIKKMYSYLKVDGARVLLYGSCKGWHSNV